MVYKKESWIASYKKAVTDTAQKPSSGMVCALATLRVIRDGICDDIGQSDEQSKLFCEDVRASMNELIKQITKGETVHGFASNASAAAKAAGFAGEASALEQAGLDA
jgi:hypothetical protein